MGNACLLSALFLPLPKRGLWSLSCALKAFNLLFSCEEEDVLLPVFFAGVTCGGGVRNGGC